MAKEDSLDREQIERYKRELRISHGYNRSADPGTVIRHSAAKNLGDKLTRMEKRTAAGEQALRTAPVNTLTHKMRHARRSR